MIREYIPVDQLIEILDLKDEELKEYLGLDT
jgi:hypothetical protein